MPSWHALNTLYPDLPAHCDPDSALLLRLSAAFHTCVPTPLAAVSTLLGSLSILSWLFAQVPQILKNYQNQSTSGLSVYFLIEWCLGDTANLLGALFTGQASWQVVVAAYYVCVDVVLVGQYVWYTHLRPWREAKEKEEAFGGSSWSGRDGGAIIEGRPASDESSNSAFPQAKDRSSPKGGSKPIQTPNNPFRFPAASSPREKGESGSSSFTSSHPSSSSLFKTKEKGSWRSSRTVSVPKNASSPLSLPHTQTLLMLSLLSALLAQASPTPSILNPPHHLSHPLALLASSSITSTSRTMITMTTPETNPLLHAGQILSWLSTFLYLGSRLPQLYKNFTRRSTAGLSPALFIAAFFGNFFYSSSIVTNPLAWGDYPPYGLRGWVGGNGNVASEWVKLATPFFLGAAGVLVLDAAMGVQFWYYGEEKILVVLEEDDDDVIDERGDQGARSSTTGGAVSGPQRRRRRRGHLKRISGWMRGWVPSGTSLPRGIVSFGGRRGEVVTRDDRSGSRGGDGSGRGSGTKSRGSDAPTRPLLVGRGRTEGVGEIDGEGSVLIGSYGSFLS
ncbi:hypothetical protein MMC25_007690 [Agyrium rufum]|nr:hypothetical protein [Agyrium rufum]